MGIASGFVGLEVDGAAGAAGEALVAVGAFVGVGMSVLGLALCLKSELEQLEDVLVEGLAFRVHLVASAVGGARVRQTFDEVGRELGSES